MSMCKDLGIHYPDYVCDELDRIEAIEIDEHLEQCEKCKREVFELEQLFTLTSEMSEQPVFPGILEQFEMKVYKRLADAPIAADGAETEEIIEKSVDRVVPFFGVHSWATVTFVSILALGILTSTILISRTSQTISGNLVPAETGTIAPVDRLELYRQREFQRNFEEAMAVKYLKNDDWTTVSQFRKLRDQAAGTSWVSVAEGQLQTR